MSKRSQRTPGLETAHPFAGLRPVNPHAAAVDIGATEIIACVPGDTTTQLVRAFGAYTVDLKPLDNGSVPRASPPWRWKARACTGCRSSRR
jgi:hypothetical protein